MYKHKFLRELRQMPQNIKTDIRTWNYAVASGNRQLQVYAELCSTTFDNENTPCKKHLRRPLKRWDKYINVMRNILKILHNIKERIERMWRRVHLWKDDENLQQYYISSVLHDFLEFLTKRIDYEWEVKEMVVLEMERVKNKYDLYILLEAWRDNRHAGGDEFNAKLTEFYRSMRLRQY